MPGVGYVVMRAIDKLDRLGPEGVRALLGCRTSRTRAVISPGARLTPIELNSLPVNLIAVSSVPPTTNLRTLGRYNFFEAQASHKC